jgi:hypothetical protein
VWGRLSEDRAKRIFPMLHDWVRDGAGAGAGAGAAGSGGPTDAAPVGRCFFKSTTAGATSFRDHYMETELRTIRPHAVQSGCTYLDFAHLTEDFGALDYESSLRNPRAERRSVFVDQVSALDRALDREVCALLLLGRTFAYVRPFYFIGLTQVHLQPWVYEELNQVLLNVLCNNR